MTDSADHSWDELNFALTCGLMYRKGPSPSQLGALPWWRQVACRILPRKHRWRMHPLAPHIRHFNSQVGPPQGHE